MRTFVVDLEDGPGDFARAAGALARAGVRVVDLVGVGEGSGLGIRVDTGSAAVARAALAHERLPVEELGFEPATASVELIFEDPPAEGELAVV